MLAAPLGKTPMDRKGNQALNSYAKKLDRALDGMTPWTDDYRFTSLRRQYGKQMRDGDSQIIVTLDGNDDPSSKLFKDAVTSTARKVSKE